MEPDDIVQAVIAISPGWPATAERIAEHLKMTEGEIQGALEALVADKRLHVLRTSAMWLDASEPEPAWSTSYHVLRG
jgi:hypothetical protein